MLYSQSQRRPQRTYSYWWKYSVFTHYAFEPILVSILTMFAAKWLCILDCIVMLDMVKCLLFCCVTGYNGAGIINIWLYYYSHTIPYTIIYVKHLHTLPCPWKKNRTTKIQILLLTLISTDTIVYTHVGGLTISGVDAKRFYHFIIKN